MTSLLERLDIIPKEVRIQRANAWESVVLIEKLCPQLIVLESRPELYLFYHREILKVLIYLVDLKSCLMISVAHRQ
ncbi:MAG: hypothetical protein UU67_C0040G0006 [Candidatus Daviesbacteria bacterium GW2011_GWB1_41_5]|uniref:Uncharacterized protein n=1 Tax=Candidatus Daviesbacteria bacterium GW2011_GWB1_41_5 TaxID=1618429 RepID=A0A0G0WL61_9BACT|nr:MAG: hypothetical protein UU67_C0040G0006 [Candidatus Daviesbacteria bacterium GW2011_GWB1_41_5]